MTEKRVLSFQPESGFFHKRAIKSVEKADYTAALKNLRKAIAMEPENMSYRLDLANTFSRMGLYERSNLEIQLLFHRLDLPAEALFSMGSNFMSMGDYDQAETSFHAYEKAAPDGEHMLAADDALAYIAECDYDTPLDRELDELSMDGKAALDAGDLDHAIECLEKALEKDPSMAYVRNNLAVAYYCCAEMDDAWKHLNLVLADDPLNVLGVCNQSMFLLSEGKTEEAAQVLKKLRLEQIEEIDELFKYCLSLAECNLHQELKLALKKIFLSCPYDISMLYLYAVNLYNTGSVQESLRTFEKLVLIEPANLLAQDGVRKVSAALKNPEQAPESLSYSFDLPQALQKELSHTLDTLLQQSPQEIQQALESEETQLYLRAGLMGTETQMGQVVLLLGFSGGPVAERMLREVLLSPTHNTFFKQIALETLRSIKAAEPFYSLQDGKLVLVRTKKFSLDPNIPEGYIRVLRASISRMAKQYNEEEAVECVAGLWSSYIMALECSYPKLTHEEAWVAALEGLFLEQKGVAPDWAKLAQEAGVTTRMLTLRKNKLISASDIINNTEEKDGE